MLSNAQSVCEGTRVGFACKYPVSLAVAQFWRHVTTWPHEQSRNVVRLPRYEKGFQEVKHTPLVLPPLKVVICGAKANIL